ncbi:alpha-SNAP-like protein [Fowlpox virus]|nr:alpha-SNAP-like protein [Fowlpox virus]
MDLQNFSKDQANYFKEIEERAKTLLKDAEKKTNNSKYFFKSLFGPPIEFEEASEMVKQAANLFKSIKQWNSAGKAFIKSAQLLLNNNRYSIMAASSFVDAANVLKKVDSYEAINCLHNAINIYIYIGNFNSAARCHVNIADIYDKDILDIDKSIEHYEKASDFYRGEGCNKLSNDCILQAASLCVQKEDFIKAAYIFEQVGYDRMNCTMLKYTCRQQFFYSVICNLCVDILNAKLALERFKNAFPAFEDFRECKFIENILMACDNEDVDMFTNTIREYDNISKIDSMVVSMLLRVKKSISENKSLR